MSNGTTPSMDLFVNQSPLTILLWFETVAAGIAYGLGFLGNLCSLIIFYSHEEFRRISTGLLFLFISISNFFHLWTLIQEFLTIYNVTLFMNVVPQCKLLYFIQNVSRAMSTYFTVTVALDRLIRSEMPMRSKLICTPRNTYLISGIYLVIFSIFWSFFLYPFATQNPVTGACSFPASPSFSSFIANVHPAIRAVIVCFIPALIMLGANIRMLMNIRRSARRVANGVTGPSSETQMPVPNQASTRPKRFHRISALDRMLFYMMISNISLFLITQIPFHIYTCIQANLIMLSNFAASLLRAMFLTWSSLYFGIAFYFYCLAAPLFRQKFLRMVKKMVCQQNLPQSTVQASTTVG